MAAVQHTYDDVKVTLPDIEFLLSNDGAPTYKSATVAAAIEVFRRKNCLKRVLIHYTCKYIAFLCLNVCNFY